MWALHKHIGSLLGMTATNTSAAMLALAFVNAKFSTNGLDGNFFLKLLIDLVVRGDVAATMGTAIGQRRFEDFVDLVVGEPGAMAMLAVVGAAGPGCGFGIRVRLALGEGCRLPLAGTLGFFELGLEANAIGLETSIVFLQFGDAPIALSASKAERSVHTLSVAEPVTLSCASIITIC